MSPNITLHHLNGSRSDRIFWVLEELQLPYSVVVHFRLPSKSAPKSLLQVSPTGKSPALVIDGETLTESAYIIHRLLQLKESNKSDVQVEETENGVFWSHFSEGSMMNLFQASAIIGATSQAFVNGQVVGELEEGEKKGVRDYSGFVLEKYLGPQMQGTIDFAESFISKSPHGWFSGTDKPGEGDFMMFFSINSLLAGTRANAGFSVGEGLRGWHKRVMSRPAAQRAQQRIKDEEEKAKSKI
ncbi:uncharacterized protein I303_101928 [Kwoniella dejecticola CBS 10117]|uniref:GST N-terminal domain-containing protein n=1 Tax=Kwoniella dejecticola CBS 10117 TaxID=1296121 RepID=A0A1A6ACE1_9TREE|nr:uncharacterized protein I303_01936 [Kwoniella dejecticola CBS 10117]OBR87724.1 hypothetical protein I303_01936 [Kwoniella dejecticola CBS 10117]